MNKKIKTAIYVFLSVVALAVVVVITITGIDIIKSIKTKEQSIELAREIFKSDLDRMGKGDEIKFAKCEYLHHERSDVYPSYNEVQCGVDEPDKSYVIYFFAELDDLGGIKFWDTEERKR